MVKKSTKGKRKSNKLKKMNVKPVKVTFKTKPIKVTI